MKEIIVDVDMLSEMSEEIDVKKEATLMRDIILELKRIIREKNIPALSAPQIGYNKRLFVVNFNGDLRTFINPVLSANPELELSREKCASIPGKEFLRIRHAKCRLMYQTPLGKCEQASFVGLAAKVIQEQVDHLNGLLLSDVGLEVDNDFFEATEAERNEVINAYLDALDLKEKQLAKEINEDAELKQLQDAGEFLASVQSGETEIGRDPIAKEDLQKLVDENK